MTTVEEVIAGLQMFAAKGGAGDYIAAEHDEIYAGNVADFTPEEIAYLESIGWNNYNGDEMFMKFV